MNERVYSGWRGVQDHKHSLLAISYEPIEGTLACRFASSDVAYMYAGVPERIYEILLHSPFAGSYLRKHVMRSYRCLNEQPPPYAGDDSGIQHKREKQAEERLDAVGEAKPIELTLFGEISGSQWKRKGSSTNG